MRDEVALPCTTHSTAEGASAPWPCVMCTAAEVLRCVTGMPPAAGAAMALLTPGRPRPVCRVPGRR